jgi:DNA-binding NarL/FixJ family response regulator
LAPVPSDRCENPLGAYLPNAWIDACPFEDIIVATIRVLLADDNGAMLAELRNELGEEFEISGTAENGEDAIRAVLRLNPDVIVLDITMPVMNGLQVASFVRERHLRTKILFLTIHEEPEYISAAFSVGACGYVTKRRLASDLALGIREVFDGRRFLSPSLRK